MDSLLYSRDNVLPKEFCQFVIDKFEQSKDKKAGISGGGTNKLIKESTDLMIASQLEDKDWKYIYDYLREVLLHSLVEYMSLHPFLVRTPEHQFSSKLSLVRTCQGRFSASSKGDPHMQMQRYVDEEGYRAWHYENEISDNSMRDRQMAFLWYLNDVFDGGETEFKYQKNDLNQNIKVEARAGRGNIFPAFWTHVHKGNKPRNGQTKYIITGWIELVEPENVSREISEDFFV